MRWKNFEVLPNIDLLGIQKWIETLQEIWSDFANAVFSS